MIVYTIDHLRGIATALEQELTRLEEEPPADEEDTTPAPLFMPIDEWLKHYGPLAPGNPFSRSGEFQETAPVDPHENGKEPSGRSGEEGRSCYTTIDQVSGPG